MIIVSFASVVVFTVRWHEIFQPCFFSGKMANTSMLQKWALQDRIGVLKHDKVADIVKVTSKTS